MRAKNQTFMSLDVYLTVENPVVKPASSGIFIREAGATREITLAEWQEKFPNTEPVAVVQNEEPSTEAYSANITHNLGKMAREAGIYEAVWRPEEIGITNAQQLIAPLKSGLNALETEPDKFALFNPSNGWGNYAGLCAFVRGYLAACEANPTATVTVSR